MGEEKLAAESNEDGRLSPSRAPLFPKPGEPPHQGARGSKKAAWRVDFCLRHPPCLQAPTALTCLPLAVWTRCSYFLNFRLGNAPCTPGKHEHPLSILSSRASSPQHATDSPSYQFPEMLHVIPKAEPVFSGSPLGCPAGPRDWATAEPVQARARYSCYSQQWGDSHDETAETRNFKRRSWKNQSRHVEIISLTSSFPSQSWRDGK